MPWPICRVRFVIWPGAMTPYDGQPILYAPPPNRRSETARRLFSDLDYYRTSYAGWLPELVRDAALRALDDAALPLPSFSVKTGRGIVLVWLHDPVPRHALPRWRLCQQRLLEVLRPFGGDAMCTDAARVLRLVGTRNSKSGTLV